MKKRILPLLAVVVVCFTMLCPFYAAAITPLEPSAPASLTLHYQKGSAAFADLEIGIYRVAQAHADGSFQLVEPFASYPINIHGITTQEQWNTVAQTLCSYIVANQAEPDREEITDTNGTVYFSDLETGLYFVREAVADHFDGTYVFNQFLAYLPTPQQDGTYNYNVEARPKCTEFVPKTQYTVTKLWQGDKKQDTRPKEVTVNIYKDGVLFETQRLNTQNNWSYTWYVADEDTSKWTVAEQDVPEAYKVKIRQKGNVFSIINTCKNGPETPPQTGDIFTPLPWVFAMCLSGIMLLALSTYSRRRR